MQWLIDIIAQRVIDTIGIPPAYIDRGDPNAYDFRKADLTLDNSWYDLDLSSIVPAGSQGVGIGVSLRASEAGKLFQFRKNGNVNNYACPWIRTQVPNLLNNAVLPVSLDENRIIEYRGEAATWGRLDLCVVCWWF